MSWQRSHLVIVIEVIIVIVLIARPKTKLMKGILRIMPLSILSGFSEAIFETKGLFRTYLFLAFRRVVMLLFKLLYSSLASNNGFNTIILLAHVILEVTVLVVQEQAILNILALLQILSVAVVWQMRPQGALFASIVSSSLLIGNQHQRI